MAIRALSSIGGFAVGDDNLTEVILANGAITTTNITLTGNIYGAQQIAGVLTTVGQPNITSVGTLTSLTLSGNIAMGTNKITNLGTPITDTDAATKGYVDTIAQGLDPKESVIAATTVNITLSSTQTIDGVLVGIGDRVLVKNQTTAANNGIYLVAFGAWTRTIDMNTWAQVPGAFTFVENGTVQADTGWVCTSNAGGTLGTTAINWVQFSSAGSYSAGTGLTLTGTTFSVNDSQTQITSVGTLIGLNVNGTVTGSSFTANTGVFSGNGSGLSQLVGANVTGTVANATYATSTGSAGSAVTAETVTNNAQPNITSVGTLTSLIVSADILPSANIIYNLGSPTKRFKDLYLSNTTIDLGSGSTISASPTGIILKNPLGGEFIVGGNGTVNSADLLSYAIANGNSNVLVTANSNVGISVSGNANILLVTGTGANIQGSLTVSGNTNLGAVGNVHITGGSANYVLITNGSGNLSWGNAPYSSEAGTVTNNAQPNITSVGIISNLIVNGSILPNVSGTSNLGSPTQRFSSLYISGNTFYIGDGEIGANANAISMNNLVTSGSIPSTDTNNGSIVVSAGGLGVYGNINAGGNIKSNINIISNANVITNNILGRTTGITLTATGTDQNISLVPTGTGTVDVASKKITSVAAPSADTDAATKLYVDTVAQGLHIHPPGQAATPNANLATITGGSVTYNNGTSGVGATLTLGVALTILDGYSLQNTNRILIKDEAAEQNNGVYVWATGGLVLTRAVDMDVSEELTGGDFIFIQYGTVNNSTSWVQIENVTIIGTTPIIFEQFSGAGTYTAGTGLTLNGTEFSITNTAVTLGSYGSSTAIPTFTVNQQGQLTAASTAVVIAPANTLTGNTLSSGITLSSLTSVGTLSNLTVSGNTILGPASNVNITGGAANYILQTDGYGNLSWIVPYNIPALITYVDDFVGNGVQTTFTLANPPTNINQTSINYNGVTLLRNTYTLSGANIILNYPAAVGALIEVTSFFGGNAGGSATTAETVTFAAQPNITSVGTLLSLVVSGNISGSNANLGNATTSNYFIGTLYGTANLATYATTANSVAGANVSGTVSTATTANTVTTAAQPNITSIGTLTSLTMSGNIAMSNSKITSLATPTADADAATKKYVDDVAQGLHIHPPAQAATTTTLAVTTGGSVTYNNGTSGVGATLTLGVALTILDGYSLTVNNRILVKNEVSQQNNGVYVWAVGGLVLTRAVDMDIPEELTGGDFVFVQNGTVNNNTSWVQVETVVTVGTSPIVFEQFSGAGTYSAGTGLTLTGHEFSITNTAVTLGSYGNSTAIPTFTVNQQGQLTAASTSVVVAPANTLTGNTLASGITVSSLTSVGTLSNLTVSGTTTLGSISNVHITGGSANYILQTDGTGNLSWTSVSTPGAFAYVDNFTGNGVQTTFTLSINPANINQTVVNYNGVTLIRNTYSLSGANITLNYPAASGSFIEITTYVGGSGGSGGSGGIYTISYASTITPDAANGSIQQITLTGNTILNAFGGTPQAGQIIMIKFTQDGTGNRILTSSMKWAGGLKTLSTSPNSVDIANILFDGTTYYGSLITGYS